MVSRGIIDALVLTTLGEAGCKISLRPDSSPDTGPRDHLSAPHPTRALLTAAMFTEWTFNPFLDLKQYFLAFEMVEDKKGNIAQSPSSRECCFVK
ncbi:hypothetical protein NDU88_011192 [Pleurodeles waltl]|uniref:Uncharacterized protein n=1 Tax=Pleurodeles waltl TaxID=8319 RepID=A0AAV7PX31_PLEWA|nr:hypothetical protein NDU88_011192 [Pleurodeles waltl]